MSWFILKQLSVKRWHSIANSKKRALTCKGACLLFFANTALFGMTSQEWQAYKQSDAYKKERAEIEARKAHAASKYGACL